MTITSGIQPDKQSLLADLWVDGYGVDFLPFKIKKQRGWAIAFTKPVGIAVPRGLGMLRDSGGQKLYFGDQTKIWRWNTASVSQVSTTVYTGTLNDTVNVDAAAWSFTPWGSWMVATNGVDTAEIDKNDGSDFVAWTGRTWTTAEILLSYAAFMLAFNTSNGETVLEWSDFDDILEWTVGVNFSSGNLVIRNFNSAIKAAEPLGERIAVYSKNQMAIVTFVGAPFFFGVKEALDGIGAVGKQAVTSDKKLNYGVSKNGIWLTDGNTFSYIDGQDVDIGIKGGINEWLQANVNWAQKSKIVAINNQVLRAVDFYFPTGVSLENDTGWRFYKRTKSWGRINYGRTSGLQQEIFDEPVRSDSSGDIFFHEFGVDADGAAQNISLVSKPLTANPNIWQHWENIRVMITDLVGTGTEVRVGQQEKLDDAIAWLPWITVQSSMDFEWFELDGVYISIEFRTTAIGDDFSLSGFLIDGTQTGPDTDDS